MASVGCGPNTQLQKGHVGLLPKSWRVTGKLLLHLRRFGVVTFRAFLTVELDTFSEALFVGALGLR